MKFVFDLNILYCLILSAVVTFSMKNTRTKTIFPRQNNYNDSVAELRDLNNKLRVKVDQLDQLVNNLRFLKKMSAVLMNNINIINDRNKATAIEIHNVPPLHWDEQYFLVERLSMRLLGSFNDKDIAGFRVFFTHKNLKNRKLIIQFHSMRVKYKWFTAFTDLSRRLGFPYIKHFPGFNLTLYDGTDITGITLHDHISKFKSSVLKVAQGLLSRFRYIKVFINDTQVYADRKLGRDTFVRYLLQDFLDVRQLKHLLLREKVPYSFSKWSNDEITADPRNVFRFTKGGKWVSRTFPQRVHLHPITTPKRIVTHTFASDMKLSSKERSHQIGYTKQSYRIIRTK